MKEFYREVMKEYIKYKESEFVLHDQWRGAIQYGDHSQIEKPIETTNHSSYASFVLAIRQARQDKTNIMRDFSIERHFGKEVVYSAGKGWVEEGMWGAGLIYPKEFDCYKIERYYQVVSPTLKQLATEIPLDLAIQYLKDRQLDLSILKVIEQIKK